MAHILMVTAVWGEWHIATQLTASVPSLLAPGNLPELARRQHVTYRVYTRQADVDPIMASPVMRDVAALLPVEVRILPETRLADPIAAHQWAWTDAIEDATTSGQYVLFIPPDVAWADRCFETVADLLDAGKTAILMTYLRVVSDTFVPALGKHRDSITGAVSISGADMVALALRHLHPLMAAYCHDSPYFPEHAEMVLWPVPGEGLLVRVLAREMFLYDPRRVTLTSQWLMEGVPDPEAVAFVDDSDRLFAVSLAPLGKDVTWHMEYRRATPLTLARWWLEYDSPANDFVAGTRVRWHTRPPAEHVWRRWEKRSDRLVRNAMAAREGIRVWSEAKALKCEVAASLLAVAVATDQLVKAFPEPRPAVIFVPTDEALYGCLATAIDDLARARGARDLGRLLRHHVAFAHDGLPTFDAETSFSVALVSAAGRRLSLRGADGRMTVNGIDAVGSGRQVGRYLIYPIAGVLGPMVSGLDQPGA